MHEYAYLVLFSSRRGIAYMVTLLLHLVQSPSPLETEAPVAQSLMQHQATIPCLEDTGLNHAADYHLL